MVDLIIIYGQPGSGKSTLAERCVQFKLNQRPIFHISSGNQLRKIRTHQAHSLYEDQINSPSAPLMLPHELVNAVMFEYIETLPKGALVLVDGYPRFAEAVPVFLQVIQENQHRLLGVIDLKISLETARFRVASRGQRPGEIEGRTEWAKIVERYQEYEKLTALAIELFRGHGVRIVEVSGEQGLDYAWLDFKQAIKTLAGEGR